MKWWPRAMLALLVACPVLSVAAIEIGLPTANDALLHGRDADFYQPTAEGSVESATFGCVRRAGARFHEGIDIKCLQRDRRGEPIDPVRAVADGEVAFINARPGLSNFGRYIVLHHRWDGVEVHTLYAHLNAIADGLAINQPVRKGQAIGTLGHSANTREGIPRERAHLHFQVNLLLNPHFDALYRRREPKAPPFGGFNGQNLFGLDPAAFLRAFTTDPNRNFAEYVARQSVAFSVLVGARPFPWLTLHPEQIQPTVAARTSSVVAYEVGATAWGMPVAVWPRGANEISDAQRRLLQRGQPVLARINEPELASFGCRRLLDRNRHGWQLTDKGRSWTELLVYSP